MAVRGYRTCSRAAVLVAVWLVVLAAAACGGGGDGDDERPSADDLPSSTESTSPPTTTVEEGVREAYEAFVAMADRLITTTVDPDDPELAERLVDPMLSATRTNLTTWRTEGQVWVKGDQSRHDVETIEIAGDTAYVTACIVGNDVLVEAGTVDAPLPAPNTNRNKTTLVRQGNEWLVQYVDTLETWPGVAGCAA
jgi:hypothetical protein